MNTDQIALTALIAARFNALQDKRKKVTADDVQYAFDEFVWAHNNSITAFSSYTLVNQIDTIINRVMEEKN